MPHAHPRSIPVPRTQGAARVQAHDQGGAACRERLRRGERAAATDSRVCATLETCGFRRGGICKNPFSLGGVHERSAETRGNSQNHVTQRNAKERGVTAQEATGRQRDGPP